jgi:uncharacterized membrane protein YebE (DUF533 family)
VSRKRSRAAKRRQRNEELCAEFEANRADPGALWAMLVRLADSDERIWKLVQAVAASRNARSLDEDERAMIAQAVAPRLAGMTPGSVLRRRVKGGEG